jgi:hypothetical protein
MQTGNDAGFQTHASEGKPTKKFTKHLKYMMHKDFTTIRLCSYHESGHILLGYFVRWTVESVKIKFKNGLVSKGEMTYNYGNDKKFIDYIMNFERNEDSYINFNDESKSHCLVVANKRIKALIGGPAAEKRILLGNNYQGIWEITPEFIRGPDFDKARQLLAFLSSKSNKYNDKDFMDEIQTVSNFQWFVNLYVNYLNINKITSYLFG